MSVPRKNPTPAAGPGAAVSRLPGFEAVPRPRGRDLSPEELREFADELADRPELWIDRIKHDSEQRIYDELLREAHVTAWLICWMDDQDTGFHDHDISSGAVAVLSGAVREERLSIEGLPRERTVRAGSSFHFSCADIHRVRHAGSDPAVTLHVYSPPLLRMGSYVIGEDGVLARRPMSYEEELRPIESSRPDRSLAA
jgi:predicted metal-dependent enzyme (double-stranded beta helix superfamily)